MKSIDVLKIAAHNMWVNKSRTILTVLIVAIVSTLIMVLLLIGTAFLENETNVSKKVLAKNGATYILSGIGTSTANAYVPETDYHKLKEHLGKSPYLVGDINLSYQNVANDDNRFPSENYYITYDYREENFDSNQDIMDWLNYKGSSLQLLYNIDAKDFHYTQSYPSGLIREGRIWTNDDNDKPNIWIGYEKACELAENGVNIRTGDTVMIAYLTRSDYMFTPPTFTGGGEAEQEEYLAAVKQYEEMLKRLNPFESRKFTVCGIYNESALAARGVVNANGIIIGSGNFLGEGKLGKAECKKVTCAYSPTTDDYNYNSLLSDMKKFTNALNGDVEQAPPQLNPNNPLESFERFQCDHIERMELAELAGTLIMIGVSALAVFVLLMSIGSVANTIIISVDKNRKFIGLMKSMGLNQNGVKKIVLCESLLSILGGVLLGFALLFALRPILITLMTDLFATIFGRFAVVYTITASIPLWLPLATVAAFFLFAILFSLSSLSKIARQDVIGTINEVA